ncbi:HDL400Cp [Eremothecium sinecaudum]|uniref:HDL400Cp n=1 Tax=Eremothecium sinecaudum TaxID=45286 RepID=A0A0X8HRX9_9SACH|nr:HDL400Cp [Eremothecium sinecaudum]AMD20344.1 HDL400Cp [Eremothecium sinecaudum]
MQRKLVRYALATGRSLHSCRRLGNSLGIDRSAENNLKTETNRLSKTLTKFWETVGLETVDGQVTVQIDNKPIRTPLGNPLRVSSNRRTLAHMLRDEWANLPDLSIKPHSLPLTSIVSRCIDLAQASEAGTDPDVVAKVGGDRTVVCEMLLRYLDTDTLLCLSPKAEYEGRLRKAQEKMYIPIISRVEQLLGKFSEEPIRLQLLDADIHGLTGNKQTEAVRTAARNYLKQLDVWDVAVFEKTVLTTKSFICGMLLLENKSSTKSEMLPITMEEIAQAATLETIYQVEKWGEVEDTHDVEKRDIRRNINAAAMVAYKE